MVFLALIGCLQILSKPWSDVLCLVSYPFKKTSFFFCLITALLFVISSLFCAIFDPMSYFRTTKESLCDPACARSASMFCSNIFVVYNFIFFGFSQYFFSITRFYVMDCMYVMDWYALAVVFATDLLKSLYFGDV